MGYSGGHSKTLDKKRLFKVICFPRNINIYGDMDKQRIFKSDLKNVLFLEILVFSDIWAKNDFESVLKIKSVSSNVDIFEYITKNDFSK